jgi:hypothetical protein
LSDVNHLISWIAGTVKGKEVCHSGPLTEHDATEIKKVITGTDADAELLLFLSYGAFRIAG